MTELGGLRGQFDVQSIDRRHPLTPKSGHPAVRIVAGAVTPTNRGIEQDSVLVPVAVVDGMAVAVVHVVDMITMGHGHVSAARSVLMVVITMRHVPRRLAFIDVIFMHPVQAPVVDVVNVIGMRYGDMPAPDSVHVIVIRVRMVLDGCGHWTPPH